MTCRLGAPIVWVITNAGSKAGKAGPPAGVVVDSAHGNRSTIECVQARRLTNRFQLSGLSEDQIYIVTPPFDFER